MQLQLGLIPTLVEMLAVYFVALELPLSAQASVLPQIAEGEVLDLNPSLDEDQGCLCSPNQWHSTLNTLEREFDVLESRNNEVETNLFIYYDYDNKMFAMVDHTSGSKAIADYSKGFRYIILGNSCKRHKISDSMRKMCLPASAKHLGQFTLGGAVQVNIWQSLNSNSTRTTILQKNCMPVSEETYFKDQDYASITSAMYLDASLGISDRTVFQPPAICYSTVTDVVKKRRDLREEKRSLGVNQAWSPFSAISFDAE